MIQSLDNDLLRSLSARTPGASLLQPALPSIPAGSPLVKPAGEANSSQVNLSDASQLLSALHAKDSNAHPLVNAMTRLMEQLTGQEVDSISLKNQSLEAGRFSFSTVEEALRIGSNSGLDYRYSSLRAEGEQLSYSAQGAMTLEDGTELTFEFKLEVSRVYIEQTQARVQVDGASLKDALAADLPGTKVRPRDRGLDIDLDHGALKRLLEGLLEDGSRRGRARGHEREHDHGGHEHGHRHHRGHRELEGVA